MSSPPEKNEPAIHLSKDGQNVVYSMLSVRYLSVLFNDPVQTSQMTWLFVSPQQYR